MHTHPSPPLLHSWATPNPRFSKPTTFFSWTHGNYRTDQKHRHSTRPCNPELQIFKENYLFLELSEQQMAGCLRNRGIKSTVLRWKQQRKDRKELARRQWHVRERSHETANSEKGERQSERRKWKKAEDFQWTSPDASERGKSHMLRLPLTLLVIKWGCSDQPHRILRFPRPGICRSPNNDARSHSFASPSASISHSPCLHFFLVLLSACDPSKKPILLTSVPRLRGLFSSVTWLFVVGKQVARPTHAPILFVNVSGFFLSDSLSLRVFAVILGFTSSCSCIVRCSKESDLRKCGGRHWENSSPQHDYIASWLWYHLPTFSFSAHCIASYRWDTELPYPSTQFYARHSPQKQFPVDIWLQRCQSEKRT